MFGSATNGNYLKPAYGVISGRRGLRPGCQVDSQPYGGKALVISRFIPILRTFTPFVAGIGEMTYVRFQAFNVAGAVLWVVSLSVAGYLFGNLPFIQNNLSLVILAIIVVSTLPALIGYLKHRAAQ